MRATTFDTMEYMNDLKNSGIDAHTAEGMTKAISKAFSQAMENKDLATKSDIKELELATQKNIYELKVELQKEIHDTKDCLQNIIIDKTTYIQKEFNDKTNFLQKEINELKIDVTKAISNSTWKTVGILLSLQTVAPFIFGMLHHTIK